MTVSLSAILAILARQEAHWDEVQKSGFDISHIISSSAGKRTCASIREEIANLTKGDQE